MRAIRVVVTVISPNLSRNNEILTPSEVICAIGFAHAVMSLEGALGVVGAGCITRVSTIIRRFTGYAAGLGLPLILILMLLLVIVGSDNFIRYTRRWTGSVNRYSGNYDVLCDYVERARCSHGGERDNHGGLHGYSRVLLCAVVLRVQYEHEAQYRTVSLCRMYLCQADGP